MKYQTIDYLLSHYGRYPIIRDGRLFLCVCKDRSTLERQRILEAFLHKNRKKLVSNRAIMEIINGQPKPYNVVRHGNDWKLITEEDKKYRRDKRIWGLLFGMWT